MANDAIGGKVTFEHAGETYTLFFGAEQVVALEELLDRSIILIGQQMLTGRLGYIRAAMWAGLRTHHPKISLSQALDLVIAIKADVATDKIQEAMKRGFPPASDGEAAEEGAADPPKDGAGRGSSRDGAS